MSAITKCPSCGSTVEPEKRYCPECGCAVSPTRKEASDDATRTFSDSVEVVKKRGTLLRRVLMGAILTFAVVAAGFAVITNSGTKVDDSELFPDPALRQYISDTIDIDKNGKLSDQEIDSVTHLEGFSGYGITSLQGLEIFHNAQSIDASNAGIAELFRTYTDGGFFSSADAFPDLVSINLSGNALTELRLSGSCQELQELNCSNNQLTSIGIKKQTGLRILDFSNNQIGGEIDLTDHRNLTSLNCSFNQLDTLSLSSSVTDLNCANNVLTDIWFESKPLLSSLYCQNNQLVDVRAGSGIAWSYVPLNPDASYDDSNNPGINVQKNSDGDLIVYFDWLHD